MTCLASETRGAMEARLNVASKALRPSLAQRALSEARSLLALALPIVIGLSASTLIGVTDTIMIAPLGTEALAATSLVMSVIIVFYAAIYGLVSVIGIGIANAHGAGDEAAIARQLRAGLLLGLLIGIAGAALMAAILPALPHFGQPANILAVLPGYWLAMAAFLIPFALMLVFKALFDSIDRPWTGVAFAFLGVIINVPLNYLLIFGAFGLPGLGLLGAGLASLAAESLALGAAFLYWRRAASLRAMRHGGGRALPLAVEQLKGGAPVALGYFGETTAYGTAGIMVGWFGAAALAANQIVGSIGSLLYMLPLGMAAAVSIRIAQAAGAGEGERLRPIAGVALGTVTGWMLLVTVAVTLFGDEIARLFTRDPEVIALGGLLFVVIGFMQVADGLQSTALGALRGLGDNRTPMIVTLIAYWLIALPAAFVLAVVFAFGSVGIWIGYGAGLAVAAIYLPLRLLQSVAKRGRS